MKEEFSPENCLKKLEKIIDALYEKSYENTFYNLGKTIQWIKSFEDEEIHDSASQKEITFWREGFLDENSPPNMTQNMRFDFLFMPSENFLKKNPANHLHDIILGRSDEK